MPAVALALLAALAYGLSDFLGGLASKEQSAWAVAATAHLIAAALTAVAASVALDHPVPADFAWAAGAGVGEGVGISFLFRGLGRGQMSVVAPISGTGAAVVPVVVGTVAGDQPSLLVWLGILIAITAVVFIPPSMDGRAATRGHGRLTGTSDGMVAGLGFGAQLALVGQISDRCGLLPLAILWIASASTVIGIAVVLGQPWHLHDRPRASVGVVGVLSATALICYAFATHRAQLPVVSVITALYPAGTVGMAALVLREHISQRQALGLSLAVVAVVLISLG